MHLVEPLTKIFLKYFTFKPLLCVSITLMAHIGYSQNVGINTTGSAPNTCAMLDIVSNSKGLLIPRVALSALNNNSPIGASIITSLLIYNTVTAGISPNNVVPGYYYWNGSTWTALSSNDWSIKGNSGTVDGTNFIGTTDNVPLNLRVNNQKAGRIDPTYKNTFYGYMAGNINSYGSNNTAVGDSAFYLNTYGSNSTALGMNAMYNNVYGNLNTALGKDALYYNYSGSQNTAVGMGALMYNLGDNNTACGVKVLYKNTNGIYNTAVGWNNMYNNTTGNFNTSVGSSILSANVTGSFNSCYGFFSLTNNTIGNANTALGCHSLKLNTSGNRNTALGDSALYAITTGSNNTGVGFSAMVPFAAGNNQIRMGNTFVTYAGIQVAWSITSDQRWKTEIKTSDLGLNFIKELNPVSYVRLNDDTKKTEYGFIAQEMEATLKKFNITNTGIITKDDDGMLSLRYNDFIAITIKALQEQQQELIIEKEKVKSLENRLVALEKILTQK